MFHCNVMHASGSNITPFPRLNILIVFNSVDTILVASYPTTTPSYVRR